MLPQVGTIALFLAKSFNAMVASGSCRQRDATVGTGLGVNFGAGFGLGIRFGIGLRNTAPLVVKPRRRTYGRHCTRQLTGNGIFNGSRREQRRAPDGRGLEQILTHLGSRIQPSCLCRSILFSESEDVRRAGQRVSIQAGGHEALECDGARGEQC